ncbi:MAG: ANTAR domain-containing protein [Gammaproteobacteria bacterium]|nr:ANTAR domain-containing protein [Gammaproteobacteria bacterium]
MYENQEDLYMDLILVADNLDSAQPLLRVASKSGYRIVKLIEVDADASRYVESLRPDALIVLSDEIDRLVLRQMKAITAKQPLPMVVFTRDSNPDSIDAAVKAGASTYVVDCNDPERLGSLLGVARSRFDEQQRLQKELLQTKIALSDRKNVERAKGIIMKTKSVSEDQAYNAMRKLAMNHNKRIGEIAEQIISASEVLV